MRAFCISSSYCQYKTDTGYCGYTGMGCAQGLVRSVKIQDGKMHAVPTPHGRLIDADELKDWIEAWYTMHRSYHPYSKSNLIPATEIVDIIDRLPTIIEAEKGGKDEGPY